MILSVKIELEGHVIGKIKNSVKKQPNVSVRQNEKIEKQMYQRKTGPKKPKTQKKDGFEKQILQFANEMTNIIKITQKSFSTPSDKDRDVLVIESDSDIECVSSGGNESEDGDSCCFIETGAGNMGFQAFEENVVIIDPIHQEPTLELEVDPLSVEIPIKSEYTEVKTENLTDAPSDDHDKNYVSVLQGKGKSVPLFKCNLCPYTSKHYTVLGLHKWRVHKIKGKSIKTKERKGKKDQPVFTCDLCPYTCTLAKVLGSHKLRAHNVKGKKTTALLAKIKTHKAQSLAPVEQVEMPIKSENTELKMENLTDCHDDDQEKNNVSVSQDKGKSVPLFKCNLCSYTSKHYTVLGVHKWRVHQIEGRRIKTKEQKGKKKQPVFTCDLCPYTCTLAYVLGTHKLRAHNVKGKKTTALMAKIKTREAQILAPAEQNAKVEPPIEQKKIISVASAEENVKVDQNVDENGKNANEKQNVKVSHNISVPVIKKCPLCPFKTKFNAALALHRKTSHNIQPPKSVNADGRWECDLCPNTYSQYHNMLRHRKQCLKRRHTYVGKPKRNCPYCGKAMFFEFVLRRHIENKHPAQWERIKAERQSTSDTQQEDLKRVMDTMKVVKRKRGRVPSDRPSVEKHCCQLCHFQTEDSHILGLHKQINHTRKKKIGQKGALKCLFCAENHSFRSHLMKHVMTKHSGVWLKFERSTEQSNLRYDEKELNRELPAQDSVTVCNTFPSKCITILDKIGEGIPSTSSCPNESNNSNPLLEDIKVKQAKLTGYKKFCKKCNRFYTTTYYRYHSCKAQNKCANCDYISRSNYRMQIHMSKFHKMNILDEKGGLRKMEDSDGNKSSDDKQKITETKNASANDSLQDLVRYETASTGNSSISEINYDEDYVPSTTKRKSIIPESTQRRKYPKKTCGKCKKSFSYNYFKEHRCVGLNCSICMINFSSKTKLAQHKCHTHTEAPAPAQEKNLIEDNKTCLPLGKKPIDNSVDESISCRKQKLYCEMCSFKTSSMAMLSLHKKKQHKSKNSSGDKGYMKMNRSLKCQFCPLLFSNVLQMKNHLSMKHVTNRPDPKLQTLDSERVECKQQSKKSKSKIKKTSDDSQSWESVIDNSKSSNSCGSWSAEQFKKTCEMCFRSYHPGYFAYHRCSMKKGSHGRKSTPPSNISVKGMESTLKPVGDEIYPQTGNIVIESVRSLTPNTDSERSLSSSNIVAEEAQLISTAGLDGSRPKTSKIAAEQNQPHFLNTVLERAQSFSNILEEETQSTSKTVVDGSQSQTLKIGIEKNQPLFPNTDLERAQSFSKILEEEKQTISKTVVDGTQLLSSKMAVEETKQLSSVNRDNRENAILKDRVKCKGCEMHFKTNAFQGHLCRPVLKCTKCTFRTRVKVQMALHNRRRHIRGDTDRVLYQCKKKFVSQSCLLQHKLKKCKSTVLHQCSVCHKKFRQEKNLELHMLQIHNDHDDKASDDYKAKVNDKTKDDPVP